jgi:hypothetical protein
VHDIAQLEGRGIPGVFVATTEFESAALAQGRALGYDPPRILVPHPIQDRTDAELQALAEAALEDVIRSLTAEAGPSGAL